MGLTGNILLFISYIRIESIDQKSNHERLNKKYDL